MAQRSFYVFYCHRTRRAAAHAPRRQPTLLHAPPAAKKPVEGTTFRKERCTRVKANESLTKAKVAGVASGQ